MVVIGKIQTLHLDEGGIPMIYIFLWLLVITLIASLRIHIATVIRDIHTIASVGSIQNNGGDML